jgi:putative zinc finger/helix-turn-helix YgiT family protein
MKKDKCTNCGSETRVSRGNYRFDEIGLPVTLKDVELVKCDDCGAVEPVVPNMNGLMHAVALAIITHERSLSGEEIRFLRKYLGLSTAEFMKLLHINQSTLSRWENGETVGPQSDRLIRLLVLNKSEQLRKHAEQLIEILPEIDDSPTSKRRPQLKVDPKTLEYEYA